MEFPGYNLVEVNQRLHTSTYVLGCFRRINSGEKVPDLGLKNISPEDACEPDLDEFKPRTTGKLEAWRFNTWNFFKIFKIIPGKKFHESEEKLRSLLSLDEVVLQVLDLQDS